MTRKDLGNAFVGLIVGFILAYAAFYFQTVHSERNIVATDLAAFYSSAAAEYYATAELQTIPNNSPMYPDIYNIEDQDYKSYLAASTDLSTELPPKLSVEVLDLEDTWDSINSFTSSTQTAWFNQLDTIRADVQTSLSYNWFVDPQ